jgi:hypothetical protein
MGPVHPNLWFIYIARSGTGCKTPPLQFIRTLAKEYDTDLYSVQRFTPAGFTEYVRGGTESANQQQPENPNNYIIRDEVSKLLGEYRSNSFRNLGEYLSELYDGYIEGSYTRTASYEGNVKVYVTLLGTGSPYFFENLSKSFFTQGLGNRVFWIIEPDIPIRQIDPLDFFFPINQNDEEADSLKNDVISMLHNIEGNRQVVLDDTAQTIWANLYNDTSVKIRNEYWNELDASYKSKLPRKVLKLATVYSASRQALLDGYIYVEDSVMNRAIHDANEYFRMWKLMLNWWQESVNTRQEHRIQSSRYELESFIRVACDYGGLCSSASISSGLDLPSRSQIAEVLGLGVTKGWLEIAARQNEQGTLTDQEYSDFKPARGPSPQVFRVTDKGRRNVLGD